MELHKLVPSRWVSKIYKLGYSFHLARRLEWRILQSWMTFNSGDKVCDVACGKGFLNLMISRNLIVYYGIDLDKKNIVLAKTLNRNNLSEFINANAEYLPFKPHSFDKVVCNCALEHFANDTRALSEMSRILGPQGFLFLTVDSFSYSGITDDLRKMHREKYAVVNFYKLDSLSKKLESAGFYILRNQYYIKSRATSFFIRIGMKLNFGLAFLLTFPIAYPIMLLGDRFSSEEGGYCLAVLAQKREN